MRSATIHDVAQELKFDDRPSRFDEKYIHAQLAKQRCYSPGHPARV
jgi:hypothetical protein